MRSNTILEELIGTYIYIRDVLVDHSKIGIEAEYFNCLSPTTDIWVMYIFNMS